jgi:hypothetical protein
MNSANGVLSFAQGRPGIEREKQTIKNTSSRLLSLDRDSVSIVVNSFEELEHGSAARLAAATGKAVLAVGPVSLCGAPSSHRNSTARAGVEQRATLRPSAEGSGKAMAP